MAPQATAYIALGSNLGDRSAYIHNALDSLVADAAISVIRTSELIETQPLGPQDQPKFLNAVTGIQTSLNPQQLLDTMFKIETHVGRCRGKKWAPRTIDLDLLLYDDQVIITDKLTVPHSQMHMRSFVLAGLCELAPDLVHPVLNVSVTELAGRLNGRDFALKPELPQLISIAGLIGVGKTTLATKLSEQLNAELLLEPYDTNPFLAKVYAGQNELALHSQLYFLLNRAEQLKPETLASAQLFFTDYIFEKDLIYARRLLDKDQLWVYERLYTACPEHVTKPVLVVYLRDTAENCLDRIHRRNRPYEQKIEPEFLSKLDTAYDSLFSDWMQCPLIKISKPEFDCTRQADIEYLINQINAYTVTETIKV